MSVATTPKRHLFPLKPGYLPLPQDRPRRRRWIWAGVAIVGLTIWALPILLAHSPLVEWAVQSATADLNGTLRVQSVSLGWFSPIRVTGVELQDPQNETMLEVPQAAGDRSLLRILLSPSSLGRFRIEQPNLSLVLRPDGSNLEDLVSKVKAKRTGTVDLGLDIVDAKVTVLDTMAQGRWQIDKLQLALTLPADQQIPWNISAAGNITDAQGSGRFQFSAEMRQSGYQQADGPSRPDQISIHSEQVPLELFQSPIRRLAAQNILLAGRLTSAVECYWDPAEVKNSLAIRGNTTVDQFRFAAPALGSDYVQLARFQADGQVALQGGKMRITQLSATSDAGHASLSGLLDFSAASTSELIASLPRQTYQIEGRLDLAKLAAILPSTLRLQADTQITSGQVRVTLTSETALEGMRWQGRLESSNLQAVNRGRPIVWENPIQLAFAARQTPQGPIVDNLDCRSSFLKFHGSGTPEKLGATATFDLTRLARELNGFIDLGQFHLGGDGWAKINWKQSAQKDFSADAQVQIQSFECTLPNRPPWKEDRLNVTLAAAGRTDFTEQTRLESASLSLETGSDRAGVRLLEPLADLRNGGVWPVEIQSQGRLESWRPRLAPWRNVEDWELGGSQQVFAQLQASADGVQVRRLECIAEELVVRASSTRFNEPHVELFGSGNWNRSQGRIDLESAALRTPDLSAVVNKAAVLLSAQHAPELSGTLQLDGNVDRLQQWLATACPQASAWQLAGQLSCKADLRQAAGSTGATVDATIRDFQLAHDSVRIQQPSVRLVARGTLDNQGRIVQLDQVELAAGAGEAAAAGSMTLAEGKQRFDLDGQVNYDLDQVSRQLQLDPTSPIRVYGRGSGGFAFHGPPDPATAEGRAGLSWQAADLYGFRVGPGSLEASLAGGLLNFRPMSLDVSEGKVQLAPRVRFAPGPAELIVEAGRVAEQVRINPAMCAAGLQYIAPALAGVTSAEGRFSLELDHCRIPLEDASRGELRGRMIIHSAEVGPGPLTHQLAMALGYTAPAQIARDSTIDFRMADGRVYHQGAAIAFPDLTIRTSGSVGLDKAKTLSLIAEMPIPPKWRGTNVLGAALKDQMIQVPIAGTLDRPALDLAALEQASRRFLQNATQNVIQDQLNRQFNRLFGPPQPAN